MAKKITLEEYKEKGKTHQSELTNNKNKAKKISIEEYKKQNKIQLKKKIEIKYLIFVAIIVLFAMLFFAKDFIFKPSLETIKDSVVKIEVYDSDEELIATGSGFCVYDSNYIVTNFHVIDGANSIKIITDDNEYHKVEDVLIFDPENDLAILKTVVPLKPLKIGSSKKLSSGNKITAIGSPLGELNTVSTGIISNAENSKGIQISATIAHGSSGGVLLDNNYRVIGITYASLNEGNSLNYAISIDYLIKLKKALDDKNYYSINDSNYESCITSFSAAETTGTSSFIDCNTSKKYYFPQKIDLLYSISSPESVYEYNILETSWSNIYNSLDYEDKQKVIASYKTLIDTNFCEYDCDVSGEVNNWNVSEFFINLSVLDKYELALAMTDIENYSGKNAQFDRVESYPLDAAQKSLILYLIGDYEWTDIHPDNKKDIFDFFDNQNLSTKELGAVLNLLGFGVEYNSNGTLTASWQ